MNRKLLGALTIIAFLAPCFAHAQNTTVDLTQLTAQGVAIYGWHEGKATVLYSKQPTYLFPVASMTKLVTAKVAEKMYSPNATFTLSKAAMTNTKETNISIVTGMKFSRDDMLRSLLVNSNNGVSNQLALSAGGTKFLKAMNSFLHTNGYTYTSWINPSGLDPTNKKAKPNLMTPRKLSYLLSDIFTKDPLLTSILESKAVFVTDLTSGRQIQIKSSNQLNRDPLYSSYVILSKTGNTDMAGDDLAFITNGGSMFDYITVVFMHSEDRYVDGQIILNWLQKVLSSKQ